MPSESSERLMQNCPACSAAVDITEVEPLTKVACPHCGEIFSVERAFDHFLLVEILGVGGMGSVFKARDTRLDRFVALKILRKDADAAYTEQLDREARVTASVNHPHVVKVFSTGHDHGQFYLVMELVERGSLADLIEQNDRLPEKTVLVTALQIARGLEAAHEVGLMHRDVKPANILFADEETAKIVDFGLAGVPDPAVAATGAIWGTPYYVAPERLKNEPEDFRSDIFSLGATLFHALAGRPPIEGETNSASKLRELKEHPPNLRSVAPGVSRATANLISRTLEPEPSARFQSYAELCNALEQTAGLGRYASRRQRRIIYAASFLFLIAAGLAIWKWFAPAPPPSILNTPDPVLVQRYDAARHQLAEGKFDAASRAFSALAKETSRQPMLNWIRLHKGLAALLGGHARPAREGFQAIVEEKSNHVPNDPALQAFFVDTAKALMPSTVVSSRAATSINSDSFRSFALLLFAAKDFEQRDFADATEFFERFVAVQPAPVDRWVQDYTSVARQFLDDLHLYESWRAQLTNAPPDVALRNLQAVEHHLRIRGALLDQVKKEEEQLSARVVKAGAAPLPTAATSTAAETRTREAALAQYRQHVLALNFTAAREDVVLPRFQNVGFQAEQAKFQKRADWLCEWKKVLTDDINRSPFVGPVPDRIGTVYGGVTAASESDLTLKNPDGTIKVPWTKLPPQTLLSIASSYIKGTADEIAHRQWLCATFASESGRADSARHFAEAAAARPEYRALLPLIAR